jgi:hypothetical protein
VRVAAFRFDLPAIVADLKGGVVSTRYPEKPSWLVFHQDGTQLAVTAINAFGADLLTLCDGTASPSELVARLQGVHGQGQPPARFSSSCRDALRQLAGLDLLETSFPQPPEEGR